MALEPRSPRLAVLIDADNTSAKIADRLFEEIAQLGEASVRRIYGDFTRAGLRGWTDILAKHAIIAHQQFAYVTGKNASDIALVIDAMDLMHSGRFEGFCLISSDSDFTRLAARIREQGLDVFGFGERKTPESFRQACRRFIYTENLLVGAQAQTQAGCAGQGADAERRGAAAEKRDRADGQRGWLGQPGRARHAARQSRAGFRSAQLRRRQAQRPGAQVRRARDRSVGRPAPAGEAEAGDSGGGGTEAAPAAAQFRATGHA